MHDISGHEAHALLHERLAPLNVAGALLLQHVGGEARHEGVAAAWERCKALQLQESPHITWRRCSTGQNGLPCARWRSGV